MSGRAEVIASDSGLGRSLIKAFIGSAGVRVTGAGFAFLVGIQLARILGSEGYGQYGLVMSIVAIVSVPTRFGLPQLLTRDIAAFQVSKDWGSIRGIQGWARKINLELSMAAILLIVGWLYFFHRNLTGSVELTLLAGLVLIPLLGQTALREATLRGLQYIVLSQLPDTLIRPAFFSLLIFLWSLSTLEQSPAVAMGMCSAAVAISWMMAGALLTRLKPSELKTATSSLQVKNWWQSALPMALTETMRVVQGHLVILLLGLMSTVAMVGLYRVANSVAMLLALPITLFTAVGAPMISKLFAQGDHRQLQSLLKWLSSGMVFFTLLLAVPFVVMGGEILGALFGPEFVASNKVLLILCCGMVGNACFGASVVLLNMTGHEKRVTRALTIALIALVVGSPPLIYYFGIIGAALGYVLSMLLWQGLVWSEAKSILHLDCSILSLRVRESG